MQGYSGHATSARHSWHQRDRAGAAPAQDR